MRPALYLLLALSAVPASAINGAIAGRIEDGTTGTGLMGAYALVAGTRLGAVADSSGYFTIRSVPPGTYRLTAKMLGYKAQIARQVVVRPGQTTSLDIAMQQQSIELATVTVVGHRRDPTPQQTSAHQIEARQVVEMPGGGEDLTHIASRDHHLQMGLTVADLITDITVEIRQDSAAYYEREPSDRRDEDGTMVERSIRLQNASTTTAFYLQDEWRRWHPRLLVLPGMRLDYSTFAREWVLSPRLGLRYALTSDLMGRVGWGFYHQAPNFVGLFERFEREIEWNLFETI
ncbi:MAG: TonB-dependent receptor, partial [Gemmatimonadota bacterium]|nr:TonB-dependent receptor [Gemmatimonadota bacterium]